MQLNDPIVAPKKDDECFEICLRYLDPEDRIFNRIISDISIELRETTLTISDSNETRSPVETEIVGVVPISTTDITEITQVKDQSSWSEYLEIKSYYLTHTTQNRVLTHSRYIAVENIVRKGEIAYNKQFSFSRNVFYLIWHLVFVLTAL